LITPAERFNTPLIRTKHSAPQLRAGLVARPHLLTQLRESGLHAFTLVCAPAGYGKTTLLANWIDDLKRTSKPDGPIICWLSLDDGDNEPNRFLRYLVAAIEIVNTGISDEAFRMLHSNTTPPLQTILAVLINDLEKLIISIYLVLDDYQFISNMTIHEGVAFFLNHLPSNVHLVIATRSDPPIPLARLRSRLQMTEIRADDLRFSYEEADYLFNQVLGLDLTPKDTTCLEERTEGWIAGLQMAALAIKSISHANPSDRSLFVKNFAGSNRYILDYLLEEVLSYQPRDIQDFLIQTSILENLSGSLCDAVTEIRSLKSESEVRSSQQILEYLERSNLFLVALDSDRLWYRYHHLFASLLRGRLRQSLDAATVQELYRRASQWYESQGLLTEAITQALAAPDLIIAADLLEKDILPFFYQSEIAQVHHWLELLPEPLILQRSLLCAVYAASIALLPPYPPQSLLSAEKWMQAAEKALPNDFHSRDLVRAFMGSIQSYWARFRGEPPEIVLQYITKALALLPADEGKSTDRNLLCIRSALQANMGLAYWVAGDEEAARQAFIETRRISSACDDHLNESASIVYLAKISCVHGQLGEAAVLCREALAFYDSQQAYFGHRVPYSGEIGVQLAEILIELNELVEAEQLLKENIELAKWTAGDKILVRGYLALARLAAARSDASGAFEYLNESEKISIEGAGLAGAQRTSLWLALREKNPEYFDLARRWGQKYTLVEFSQGFPQMEWTISLSFARLILADEYSLQIGNEKARAPRLVSLLEWLERQEQTMHARGWVHWEIQLHVIEYLTRQIMGDKTGALVALRQAADLSAPGGYVRIFVEEGEPLRKLLVELENNSGWSSPYHRKLLLAFPDTSSQPVRSPGPGEGLIDPLTEREVEVLQSMAEGLTNHQIAEKLILAEGTVKFYVHAVLAKLGVHNRTQAIIEAKKQGII
jgi:LuxR family maltose regulon positive regulatory protein